MIRKLSLMLNLSNTHEESYSASDVLRSRGFFGCQSPSCMRHQPRCNHAEHGFVEFSRIVGSCIRSTALHLAALPVLRTHPDL